MPSKKIASLAAAFLLLCMPIQKTNAQNRIAIIGSSTAYGTGATAPSDAWVNRMKNYFIGQHLITSSADVVNLAEPSTSCVTGMPTGYVSPYNSASYSTPNTSKNITAAIALNPRPNIIIVSYPTNGYDWMPFNDIMNNLKVIKKTANDAGVVCFVTTTQPRNTFSDAERKKLKELKDSIIAAFGFYSLDFWTPLATADNKINPDYNADNVHPNSAGHEALFNQIVSKNLFSNLAPLPVIRLNLVAQKYPAIVRLKGQVETDVPFTYLEIQKSVGNGNFNSINKIKANGTGITNYTYNDSTLTTGRSFYRLKITDEQGKAIYSNVASISRNNTEVYQATVFPKISRDEYSIRINAPSREKVTTIVMNTQGIIVQQQNAVIQAGTNQIICRLANQPAGLYFVTMLNEQKEQILTEKIIRNN